MKLFSICQAILSACFGTLTITDDAISRFVENPQRQTQIPDPHPRSNIGR